MASVTSWGAMMMKSMSMMKFSSYDSQSDSSDSGSSSADEAFVQISARNGDKSGLRNVSAHAVTEVMYRHGRTSMLHFGHAEHSDRTACGRSMGTMFKRSHGDPDRAWPHCRQCWGNVD